MTFQELQDKFEDACEEQLFKLLAEVFLIDAYPHEAVLDDVGHKHDVFV